MAIKRICAAEDAETLFEAEGPDFVRCAYLTILHRKPDPSGRKSAEDFLRRGGRKIDLAWSLVRSEEGSQIDVCLSGLSSAFRRRTVEKLPVLGWLLRPFLGLEPIGPAYRQYRAISFAIAKMHDTLSVQLRRLESDLELRTQKFDLLSEHAGPGIGSSTLRSRQIMKFLEERLT